MELLYVWAEDFRNLKHVGFNFSEYFQVTFEYNQQVGTRVIQIYKNKDRLFRFWGKNVSEITALVGENGCGKTNLLDLLGLTYVDRVREGLNKGEPVQKYFIVYHISEDLFVVEGIGLEQIRNSIRGITTGYGPKECYSFLVSYMNGHLHFKDNLQESEKNVLNRVSFLNIRSIFKNGYTRGKHGSNNDLYLFERLILSPNLLGNLEKYRLLLEIKNQKDRKVEERLIGYNAEIYLKIKIISPAIEVKLDLKTSGYFFQIETDINKSKRQIHVNRKEAYINKLLESFVQHEFKEVISQSWEEDPDTERADKRKDIQEVVSKIEFSEDYFREYYLSVLEVIDTFNDMSTEYEEVIDDLLVMLNQIQDDYFNEDVIKIKIGDAENNTLVSLLGHLDTSNIFSPIVNIDFGPTSSGEEAIINLLAAIKDGVKRLSSSGSEKIIVLLDEPDLFMHPEWSRRIISVLLNYLNIYTPNSTEYQMVISTHSPFIISDLPKQKIIALGKSTDTGACIIKKILTEQTFAGNIHTLFAEEFFMKATIGEFARLKITQVIKELSEAEVNTIPKNREIEIEYIISIIGEPVLRKKLNKLYQDKFYKEDVDWQAKRISQLEREISLLGNRDDLRNILDLLEHKIKELKEKV